MTIQKEVLGMIKIKKREGHECPSQIISLNKTTTKLMQV